MKRNLCNSAARLAISRALGALDQHYRELKQYKCEPGFLDGFQRIRLALWRLRMSLAGSGNTPNKIPVQTETLALADKLLRRELAAAKLDNLSYVPVQERGKPLRYIKPGPHYLDGALAAYDAFRGHFDTTAR
jgi:hypothetical protein